jgi:hypothetical protein
VFACGAQDGGFSRDDGEAVVVVVLVADADRVADEIAELIARFLIARIC